MEGGVIKGRETAKGKVKNLIGQSQKSVYSLNVEKIYLFFITLFNSLKILFYQGIRKKKQQPTINSRFPPFPRIKCRFHGNCVVPTPG